MKNAFGDEWHLGFSRMWLLVVVGFSATAFLVRWAGLVIPVIGSEVNIDPREILVTLGAALTGPVGGLVIVAVGAAINAAIIFFVSRWLVGLVAR
jgi:hypothetical protein